MEQLECECHWTGCCSVASDSATPRTAAGQASLSLTISQSLPKFMSIASVMPSSHLILWHPFLLLPSIFPSIRDFSNESAVHIRWPKSWSCSFSPSSEFSGLTSFQIDWFDLLAVYWTGAFICLHLMDVESGLINCLTWIHTNDGRARIWTHFLRCLYLWPALTRSSSWTRGFFYEDMPLGSK